MSILFHCTFPNKIKWFESVKKRFKNPITQHINNNIIKEVFLPSSSSNAVTSLSVLQSNFYYVYDVPLGMCVSKMQVILKESYIYLSASSSTFLRDDSFLFVHIITLKAYSNAKQIF